MVSWYFDQGVEVVVVVAGEAEGMEGEDGNGRSGGGLYDRSQ